MNEAELAKKNLAMIEKRIGAIALVARRSFQMSGKGVVAFHRNDPSGIFNNSWSVLREAWRETGVVAEDINGMLKRYDPTCEAVVVVMEPDESYGVYRVRIPKVEVKPVSAPSPSNN
jgi:hypothetical protein